MGRESFSFLLNEFVYINKTIGNASCNDFIKLLCIHCKQLVTSLQQCSFIADIITYTDGESAKDNKYKRSTKQTYVVAYGIEFTIYTKNLAVRMQFQA